MLLWTFVRTCTFFSLGYTPKKAITWSGHNQVNVSRYWTSEECSQLSYTVSITFYTSRSNECGLTFLAYLLIVSLVCFFKIISTLYIIKCYLILVFIWFFWHLTMVSIGAFVYWPSFFLWRNVKPDVCIFINKVLLLSCKSLYKQG